MKSHKQKYRKLSLEQRAEKILKGKRRVQGHADKKRVKDFLVKEIAAEFCKSLENEILYGKGKPVEMGVIEREW